MATSTSAVARRRLAERDRLFEEAEDRVWDRKLAKGFTSIPRAMPLMFAIMDALSKGAPISSVYLDLWLKAFDEMYLIIESPTERAFFSGFGGQRAVTTWTTRMRKLVELGFIEVVPGTRGEFHHCLLVDPHRVISAIEKSPKAKAVGKLLFEAYHQRCREVGAES